MAPRAMGVSAAVLSLALLAVGGCADWGLGLVRTVGIDRVTLIAFDDPTDVEGWQSITDTTLGGRSTGALVFEPPGTAKFVGTVSPGEGRGFASVRTDLGQDALVGLDGLLVHIRGDGRRYIIYLKTGEKENARIYQTSFDTRKGHRKDVLIPFAAFDPYYRGLRLRPWRNLPARGVVGLGVMIADEQEGPFELEIDSIQGYSVPNGPNG